MNYLNKKDIYHYDSFIFGNSRSLFYKIEDWEKYIENYKCCYHFSESGGSVNGLFYKVRLIDSLKGEMNNALFVVDCDLLRRTDQEQEGAIVIMPPALTNNENYLKFHKEHFFQWMNPQFFYYWLEYKLTGKYKTEMSEYIALGRNYKYSLLSR